MKTKRYFLKLFIIIGMLVYGVQGISQVTKVSVVDSVAANANKWKIGVGFGLNFVGGTNISFSPNVTYELSEKVSLGGGLMGSYSAIKDLQSTTTLGVNVITEYRPIPQITTLLEHAQLKVNTTLETPEGEIKDDFWEPVLFVGAGYNVTKKILVGAKFNILYTEGESVYSTPVVPFVNISF